MRKLLLTLAIVLGLSTSALAGEVFVSPDGDDDNYGTKSSPVRTLERAARLARRSRRSDPEARTTVYLRGGTYYRSQPLVLGPEDSGGRYSDADVVWKAYNSERPVISGGTRLDLEWKPHKNGILKARVPQETLDRMGKPDAGEGGIPFDQLFVNGDRQRMARYPNFDPDAKYFGGTSPDAISAERVKKWSNPAGGFIHALHPSRWGSVHYRITGADENGELDLDGGWQNNRPKGMHKKLLFVENIFEELDAPHEWYFDRDSRMLYFKPPEGMDISDARFEVAGIKNLIVLRGTEENAVVNVEIEGLTFTHTARTFMLTREPLLRSDWRIYRGGAVLMEGAGDCAIRNCSFEQNGGNAIFFSGSNHFCSVEGCRIVGAGGGGVNFVGNPEMVRSPGFHYGEHVPFEELDWKPGPKDTEYPSRCTVSNCLIHSLGNVEKQVAGVNISMSRAITISHCSIYDVPRAGINICDGTWGGHVIEHNDVFQTVQETGDHGSFNSWGRDRYWPYTKRSGELVEQHPGFPTLDARETTVIRHNRWRCDHGWDIDLDDGSSNYHIYNNLCLRGGIKLREGYYRTVENNIIVGNSLHPHVWYHNSGDVFRRNIVMNRYRPARMHEKPWGKEMDHNLLHQPDAEPHPAEKLQEQSGRDEHSIVADAQFVDPENGDYRVKEGSPALELGFENFAMDNFGVTDPFLRAQARTPNLGRGKGDAFQSDRDETVHEWRGARIKNISGLGERSSVGLARDIGVRLLKVPEGSAAAKIGLREDDVILGYNGQSVKNVEDLLQLDNDGMERLDVLRNQRRVRIESKDGDDNAEPTTIPG